MTRILHSVLKLLFQTVNVAHCAKCAVKHARPVGARCRKNLNVSAPALSKAQEEDVQHQSDNSLQQQVAWDSGVGASALPAQDTASQVESKLDLILQKMHDLEKKNLKLEKRLDQQKLSVSSNPQPAHSSSKRSHKCSAQGDSRVSKKKRHPHTAKHVRMEDTSDEELTGFSSPQASST